MKHLTLAALCIALLAGCAGNDNGASDDAACQAKGLKPGSQDYVQCREALFNARAAKGAGYSPATVIPLQSPVSNSCSTAGNVTSCHTQ